MPSASGVVAHGGPFGLGRGRCGAGGQPQVSLRTAVSFRVGVGWVWWRGSAPGVVAHGGVLSGCGGVGVAGGGQPQVSLRTAVSFRVAVGWVWWRGQPQVSLRMAVSFRVAVGWVWWRGQPQVSLRTAVSFRVAVGWVWLAGSAPGVVAHGGVLSGCGGVGVRWGSAPGVVAHGACSFLLVSGRTDESGLRPRCRSRRLESLLVGRMRMSSEISGQNILTHCGPVVAVWWLTRTSRPRCFASSDPSPRQLAPRPGIGRRAGVICQISL